MVKTAADDSPILSRLQYLTDYLFGGNVRTFEEQLGFYRRQLQYILRGDAKVPFSLLSSLVVDYGVSSEWLLTGRGPVFAVEAFSPVSDKVFSAHTLFDPTAMRARTAAVSLMTVRVLKSTELDQLAAAIFQARVHNAPVLLVFDWPALSPQGRTAICSLMRADFVTALATTTRGLYKDVGAKAAHVIPAARRAARCGLGLGAAIGRWLHLDAHSVFKVAHQNNTPISVYYAPGDDYRYFEAAALGATVGAELGAVTQIDLFLLAEQIRLFVTKEHSVCIDATNHKSVTALLTNAIAAAHRTTNERQGRLFKIDSKLLPFVVKSCHTAFEGNKRASRRNLRSR